MDRNLKEHKTNFIKLNNNLWSWYNKLNNNNSKTFFLRIIQLVMYKIESSRLLMLSRMKRGGWMMTLKAIISWSKNTLTKMTMRIIIFITIIILKMVLLAILTISAYVHPSYQKQVDPIPVNLLAFCKLKESDNNSNNRMRRVAFWTKLKKKLDRWKLNREICTDSMPRIGFHQATTIQLLNVANKTIIFSHQKCKSQTINKVQYKINMTAS